MFYNKKLSLALAVSAIGCASGVHAVDLNNTAAPGTATYLADTVYNAGAPATSVLSPLATMALDVTNDVGFGFSEDTQLFVRYDLTNGTFEGDPTLAGADISSGAGVISSGGDGQSFVIFSVTVDSMADGLTTVTGITQVSDFVLSPSVAANEGILTPDFMSPVSVTYRLYNDPVSAGSAGTPIATSNGTVASYGPSYTLTVMPDTVADVAEVAGGFLTFVGGGLGPADLGDITVADSGALITSTSAASTVATVCGATSNLVIAGDANLIISDGTAGFDAPALARATLGAAGASAADATSITFAAIQTLAVSAVNVTAEGTPVIAASGYDVTYNCVANAGFNASSAGGSLQGITRNGTTVEIPFLTTFSDYNQRLIIVNRNSSAVDYSVVFTTETGVTAVAGASASGSIPANTTAVIRANDLVTLTGGTRTAGTLTVVATNGSIDAATTQVNLSDASTDTVYLTTP